MRDPLARLIGQRHLLPMLIRTLLAAIVALPLAFLPLAPAMAQTDATARYIVTLAGINIANVSIRFADDGRRYSIDLDANVTGLGNLVAQGTANSSAAGSSANAALVSDEFRLATRTNAESFDISVAYENRNVSAFMVDPPLASDYGRVPIERAHLTNVGDPLSAFLVRGAALSPDLCRRDIRIFTGLERFDLDMRFSQDDVATSPRTGYQGPVVLCTMRYEAISGHYTTSEITTFLESSDRMMVWFAPLNDTGWFLPYRILVGTSAGDLSVVLTSLTD